MSAINTVEVRFLIERLEKTRSHLEALRTEASGISTNAKTKAKASLTVQVGTSARIIALALDQYDASGSHRTVQSVRGMEMILLGLKKWYAAEIEKVEQRLLDTESKIAAHTRGAA